jgi:hypothetical protein
VRKTPLLSHFYVDMIILPRQARDKHEEKLRQEAFSAGRDASGQLEPNPERFPLGMKHLGDHMHSLGVSFGIYSDEGTRTCGGFQGSEGHEAKDAKTFADWGVE